MLLLQGTSKVFAFFLRRSLTVEPKALPLAGGAARHKQVEGSAWCHTLCLLNKTDKFSLLREEALQLSIPRAKRIHFIELCNDSPSGAAGQFVLALRDSGGHFFFRKIMFFI